MSSRNDYLDKTSALQKLVSLLELHLHELQDEELIKLGSFIEYELRERDIDYENLMKNKNA